MRVRLEQVPLARVPWDELDRRDTRSVFCTHEWLDFLRASQRAQPVVARVLLDREPVGWFTGAVVRRGGVRLLGSPLPGWSTSYMGYDWDDPSVGSLLPLALAATRRWAHARLGCAHLEVLARVDPGDLAVPPGMSYATFHSFERSLVDDATMLAAMSTNARRNIRRSQRRGVRIEAVGAEHAADFAWESFSQVRNAFLRREVSPSYGPRRTRELLDAMLPGGRLLATRAVTADGRCAGTCISAGTPGGRATFLTGAADPTMLDVRPNEALMWHAMTTWRDRGALVFDFGGGGTYKQKFGCDPVESAWVRSSLLPGAEPARATARRWYRRVHYLGDHAPSWRQVLAPSEVADAAAGAAGRTG